MLCMSVHVVRHKRPERMHAIALLSDGMTSKYRQREGVMLQMVNCKLQEQILKGLAQTESLCAHHSVRNVPWSRAAQGGVFPLSC